MKHMTTTTIFNLNQYTASKSKNLFPEMTIIFKPSFAAVSYEIELFKAQTLRVTSPDLALTGHDRAR